MRGQGRRWKPSKTHTGSAESCGRIQGKAKAAAGDLAGKMPSVTQVVQAAGSAATTAAKGGWSVLTTTVGGTIKGFTTFSAAAATAMVKITKGAVENYGDYEQLVGGVENTIRAGGQSLSEYAKGVGKTTTEAKDEYNNLIKAQEAVIEKSKQGHTRRRECQRTTTWKP